MNQAIAKQDRPVDLLKATINAPSIQEQFKNALGEHKDTFVASLIDLYTGDKSLQTCKPSAIIIEALRAATLRLPLNKALGFAYIVVYNNSVKVTNEQTGREEWIKVPTPTFIPGYKGYIQLAMRTGQYRTINADVVYEGEVRKVNKLTGEIAFDGEKTSDKIIGYFCYFELLNGFSKTLYVTVEDMAAYAKRYSPSVKKETTVAQLIAKANASMAVFSAGITLSAIKFTINWQAVLGSILKMIVMPAFVLILGLVFHMEPINLKMLVVACALPPAFSGIIIADEYDTYVAEGTSSLTLSVILFIGFCPLWLWITDLCLAGSI